MLKHVQQKQQSTKEPILYDATGWGKAVSMQSGLFLYYDLLIIVLFSI